MAVNSQLLLTQIVGPITSTVIDVAIQSHSPGHNRSSSQLLQPYQRKCVQEELKSIKRQQSESVFRANVPIHCSLCPPSVSREPQTIWKYNAINHLLISHSDEDPTQAGKYKVPVIPGDLMMDMFVTRQEEQWMKINPNATSTFRREAERARYSE